MKKEKERRDLSRGAGITRQQTTLDYADNVRSPETLSTRPRGFVTLISALTARSLRSLFIAHLPTIPHFILLKLTV